VGDGRTWRARCERPRTRERPPAKPAMPHIALRLRPGGRRERLVPGTQALDGTTLVVLRASVCLPPCRGLARSGVSRTAVGRRRARRGRQRNEHAGLAVMDGIWHAPTLSLRRAARRPWPQARIREARRRAEHRDVEQVVQIERCVSVPGTVHARSRCNARARLVSSARCSPSPRTRYT